MVTLPLKLTCNKQCAIIRFFGAVQYTMTSVLQSQQYTFGVRKCWMGTDLHQKPRCNQSFISGLDISQRHSLHQAFRSLLTPGTKCLNKLGRYVEKW